MKHILTLLFTFFVFTSYSQRTFTITGFQPANLTVDTTVFKLDGDTALTLKGKTYKAIINQSSTDDPAAVVLENGLGVTVTWSRSAEGQYLATFSSPVSGLCTYISQATFDAGTGAPRYITGEQTSSTTFQLYTFDEGFSFFDGALVNYTIQISFYPYSL